MAQIVFPSPPKSISGSQRRSRSSTTARSVQFQQEEPLRVKNFVGAALPSPEYLRWFHSKVKYDELLRFYAHLTERVALSGTAAVSWPDVSRYIAETFSYFQKDHPMRILFKEGGDNLRQLYDELCTSLRTDSDNLLVHRDFTNASFAKRLAVACYVKARRWAELEDTEGQRLEFQKFRDQFREAEINGRSSVDLDKVVEECNPFLLNYFRQGTHFRYPDVAKAYSSYLRLAYQKFGFDFPVGDDFTVLTSAVPSPPAAPESPFDESEAQNEPTTSHFPNQDVEMSSQALKEEDKTVFPDAVIENMSTTSPSPLEAMEVDEKDSQHVEKIDGQEDISAVKSLVDTSDHLDPSLSTVADVPILEVKQEPSASFPSPIESTEPVASHTAEEEIVPVAQPPQMSQVVQLTNQTPENPPVSKISSFEKSIPETKMTVPVSEIIAEIPLEEIPSPALLPTSPVRSTWSPAVTTPLPSVSKTKIDLKKKPILVGKKTKQFPAIVIVPKAFEQPQVQTAKPSEEETKILPAPDEIVPSEKLESNSSEKSGKEENEDIDMKLVPKLDQFFLDFLANRQRKFTTGSMTSALRGLLGGLFKEIPTDLVDYDPFKLPTIQPKYKDSIEKPQSFLQLVKRLKEASCDVEEVSRELPLVALNAVAYNSGSSEVTKLGLQLQQDCSTILRKVIELEETPDLGAFTTKLDALKQAVTEAKINRKARDRSLPSLSVEEVVLLGDYKTPLVKTPLPSSRTRQSVQQIIVSPPSNLTIRTRAAKSVSTPSIISKSARKKV